MSGFDDGNSGHHQSSAADFCQIYTAAATASMAVVAAAYPTAADSFCVFPPPRCSPSSLLPNFMVPKKVQFMDGLPKTSTGKIQKFQLRAVAKTLVPPPENAETKRRPTPQPQSKRETPRRDHHRNQEQVLALSSRLSLMRSFPFPGHRLPSS